MKKKLLCFSLVCSSIAAFSQGDTPIEGKWVLEDYPNTLFILENGQRYTYYCNIGNCDSIFNTYEAADGNHMPEINDYSFGNDSLIIDLNFGNFFIEETEFLCDSNIIDFPNSSTSRWIRLGTNVADCSTIGIKTPETNQDVAIYPNPSANIFNFSFDNNTNGEILVHDLLGRVVFDEKINGQFLTIDLAHLAKGTYHVSLKTNLGIQYKKIIKD